MNIFSVVVALFGCFFFIPATFTKADEQNSLKIIDSSKENLPKSNPFLVNHSEHFGSKIEQEMKASQEAVVIHLDDCARLMNNDKENNTTPTKNKNKNKIEINIPQIPKVNYDTLSLEVYARKPDKIMLSSKDEAQFHFCFLKEIFEATRKMKPSEEELKKNMFILERGATREGIYHSLVLDGVYLKLESKSKTIKVPASEFAMHFCSTYTGYKLTYDNLKSQNIYTVKRIVAEKALEIMDAFGDNRNDLENWYVVLSSDIAEQFPLIWNNDLRREPSKNTHKEWASNVPVQHIKSEVLIKLHSVFNSMM